MIQPGIKPGSVVTTTQCNDFDVKVDMFRFFRNIRLREYFSSPNRDISTEHVGCSPVHTPPPFRRKGYFDILQTG